MFTTPLPGLPAQPKKALDRDVSKRPGWPFPELTDQQRIDRFLFEIAARKGALRGVPSIFGALE